MLCDRDALPTGEPSDAFEREAGGRLKVLPRYHLENYFLDSAVLARVFEGMEREGSWLRDAEQIELKLREIAEGLVPYAAALMISSRFRQLVGNIDIMPGGLQSQTEDGLVAVLQARAAEELGRVASVLDAGRLGDDARTVTKKIRQSLETPDDSWKVMIPGRPVFNTFAGKSGLGIPRLRQLYVHEALKTDPSPFKDVIQIFEQLRSL